MILLNISLSEEVRKGRTKRKDEEDEKDVLAGALFERPDVDGVYELCPAGGGAAFFRYFIQESIGGKHLIAVNLEVGSGEPVLCGFGEGSCDGGGDGSLLRVVRTCTRGDAMGAQVIELRGDRFHGLKGGGSRFEGVKVDGHGVAILAIVAIFFDELVVLFVVDVH